MVSTFPFCHEDQGAGEGSGPGVRAAQLGKASRAQGCSWYSEEGSLCLCPRCFRTLWKTSYSDGGVGQVKWGRAQDPGLGQAGWQLSSGRMVKDVTVEPRVVPPEEELCPVDLQGLAVGAMGGREESRQVPRRHVQNPGRKRTASLPASPSAKELS